MKFAFFKNSHEKYLLPFLLVIFIINYHYYAFYQKDFKKIFRFVPFSLKQNNYEQIQEWHPYYQIYKLAKQTNNDTRIIYLKSKKGDGKRPFLHELNIMVDYFFYPRFIMSVNLTQFKKIGFKKGEIIISDFNLAYLEPKKEVFLTQEFKRKDLFRINRWKEDDYFIYLVE